MKGCICLVGRNGFRLQAEIEEDDVHGYLAGVPQFAEHSSAMFVSVYGLKAAYCFYFCGDYKALVLRYLNGERVPCPCGKGFWQGERVKCERL
jgi:hypothetical protein